VIQDSAKNCASRWQNLVAAGLDVDEHRILIRGGQLGERLPRDDRA
jgi:hypothetical protein